MHTRFDEIIEKIAFNYCNEWHDYLDISRRFNLLAYQAPCRGVETPWQDQLCLYYCQNNTISRKRFESKVKMGLTVCTSARCDMVEKGGVFDCTPSASNSSGIWPIVM